MLFRNHIENGSGGVISGYIRYVNFPSDLDTSDVPRINLGRNFDALQYSTFFFSFSSGVLR